MEIGSKIGRLTVEAIIHKLRRGKPKWRLPHAICRCSCGNVCEVRLDALKKERPTASCGCLSREQAARHFSKLNLRGPIAGQWEAFTQYRDNANIRKLEFALTFDEFISLVSQPCYYCDASPRRKLSSFVLNGLDRSNNSVGYRIDNVVPACYTCNRAKWSTNQEDFLLWVGRVAEHRLGLRP